MSKEADFSQLERFIQAWQSIPNDFDAWLRQFLLEQAQRAVKEIKNNTTVITGALRNSWAVGNQVLQVGRRDVDEVSASEQEATIESVKVSGSVLDVTIFNQVEYASFYEFGHRSTKGNWVDGRFVMKIGIDQIEQAMPARFDKDFKKYLKSKGAT